MLGERRTAMLTVGAVVEYVEQLAPSRLAGSWDNVGLLLGERNAGLQRLMTCLTVTPESAAEAIDGGAGLIVSHHPLFFRPVKRLTDANPEGRMLLALARAGVAVCSPHTAFDSSADGINELLASRLELRKVHPLRPGEGPKQCKLVVFVPDKDLARVSDALFAAGAGHIGQYSECSFRLSGTGTFFGSEATNPTVGQKGRREEVAEWRLEAICPERLLDQAITALRRAHSYEEPAFDIYPLQPAPRRHATEGDGRIGELSAPLPLGEVTRQVKERLSCGPVQVVGNLEREVRRVAIACGAGSELMPDAIRARADVLLSGEMRFHDYLAASASGLALVLPGHYATERCGAEHLADRLKTRFPELHVWASARESDPVRWV
jgi:dinuclear metal center YbgI/SA1388 family protein